MEPQNLFLQLKNSLYYKCCTLFYCLHSHLRPTRGRRSLSESSRTKGGGSCSHNSWKERITSLYLPCCQALCQHSINNNQHDNNSWNKWTEIKHRKSGATAGMCSSIMTWGREVLDLIKESPTGTPSPLQPQGKEQAVLLTLMQMQEVP